MTQTPSITVQPYCGKFAVMCNNNVWATYSKETTAEAKAGALRKSYSK
jgi:hypothetical protein